MRNYKHITFKDRMKIEQMMALGKSVQDIADSLGVHQSSLYREIKRGRKNGNGDYDARYADNEYRKKLQEKGATPKLIADNELAEFISHCILDRFLSPRQIIALIEQGDTPFSPDAAPSIQTIYSAIENGYIPNVTKEKMTLNKKATMFSDGHIIIPKGIRSLLRYSDGDIFEIEINEETQEIIIRKTSDE